MKQTKQQKKNEYEYEYEYEYEHEHEREHEMKSSRRQSDSLRGRRPSLEPLRGSWQGQITIGRRDTSEKTGETGGGCSMQGTDDRRRPMERREEGKYHMKALAEHKLAKRLVMDPRA